MPLKDGKRKDQYRKIWVFQYKKKQEASRPDSSAIYN